MVGIFPARDAIIRLVAPCWPSRMTNGPSPAATWARKSSPPASKQQHKGPVGRMEDPNITLATAGDEGTRMTLTAVYRPPFGALGVLLNRVATATISIP